MECINFDKASIPASSTTALFEMLKVKTKIELLCLENGKSL